MKLVAVTACPTGIAHTYMAAEQLERVAKKMGFSIKVETQGAMGIENELEQDEINEAAAVIFAVGITVQKPERFEGKKIFEFSVQEAIKNAEAILNKVKEEIGG
ncbi:MAG: PTS fructose transporter subunit IIB [Candidatus Saccharicenans sp.]|jgi:fructose-specific phosphotransferase system IIB component|uniref:PTS system, fructose-specific, IIB component n=1 Tax=Candidatus Saccharicenans subterraneus TaxID=2508984 RepID=A0A3E2BKJ8_9BACT|nr:PTS fructose transporter subunit IIB [Candidatus Saccharicenans sp.]MDH7575332.1 PTS fructose transporter subunit IIB [Candidatus Saccharicenans sp.]NPV82430.1 PTS fructose transporter subunit IIB [Candidatus Aminicenantes bacterium]RFT15265.1 MAG: PTS system, fructose-specific, IIB component [Candidatus Saccharicenans subterraneum]